MRRIVAAVAAVTVVLAVAACAAVGPRADLLPMAAVTPSPTVKADPSLTLQVCGEATTAVAGASMNFSAQLDVIDRAAADGDQSAVLTAADAIQSRLLSLSGRLSSLAARPVRVSVRRALTRGAATLRAICAVTYPGNQADIARQLVDISGNITRACG